MRIGFYGPSSVSWINSPNDISFIDQLKKKYNAKIVNIGVPQSSEERILFQLKKTPVIPRLDYAVIFHSSPKYLFIPECTRDLSIADVNTDKMMYLWSENKKQVSSLEEFEQEFFSYGNVKDIFTSTEDFVSAMQIYKKYFYHPDLFTNRYYSSMMMIDSYLMKLGCKSFHAVVPAYTPSWLELKSGTIDRNLATLTWRDEKGAENPRHPNNLTIAQNNYITTVLSAWIDSFQRDS